jgi:transcription antitermination factor NusG
MTTKFLVGDEVTFAAGFITLTGTVAAIDYDGEMLQVETAPGVVQPVTAAKAQFAAMEVTPDTADHYPTTEGV